jgi:hypothetical protein
MRLQRDDFIFEAASTVGSRTVAKLGQATAIAACLRSSRNARITGGRDSIVGVLVLHIQFSVH